MRRGRNLQEANWRAPGAPRIPDRVSGARLHDAAAVCRRLKHDSACVGIRRGGSAGLSPAADYKKARPANQRGNHTEHFVEVGFRRDTAQEWVTSPGMFSDRLWSPYSRITQTIACFLAIEFAFIPPIHLWGVGEARTPLWLWTTDYSFFLNLLLPAFLLVSTLVATGARPLWLHLEKRLSGGMQQKTWRAGGHFWDAVRVGRLQGSRLSLRERSPVARDSR